MQELFHPDELDYPRIFDRRFFAYLQKNEFYLRLCKKIRFAGQEQKLIFSAEHFIRAYTRDCVAGLENGEKTRSFRGFR